MSFTYTSISVGPLLPKQVEVIDFPYVDMTIIELKASCDCSDVRDDKENQRIRVKFTAKDIPPQLRDKASYSGERYIFVKYHLGDPSKEQEVKLTIKVTVLNPIFHGK